MLTNEGSQRLSLYFIIMGHYGSLSTAKKWNETWEGSCYNIRIRHGFSPLWRWVSGFSNSSKSVCSQMFTPIVFIDFMRNVLKQLKGAHPFIINDRIWNIKSALKIPISDRPSVHFMIVLWTSRLSTVGSCLTSVYRSITAGPKFCSLTTHVGNELATI